MENTGNRKPAYFSVLELLTSGTKSIYKNIYTIVIIITDIIPNGVVEKNVCLNIFKLRNIRITAKKGKKYEKYNISAHFVDNFNAVPHSLQLTHTNPPHINPKNIFLKGRIAVFPQDGHLFITCVMPPLYHLRSENSRLQGLWSWRPDSPASHNINDTG
jgi:hypothetical protein